MPLLAIVAGGCGDAPLPPAPDGPTVGLQRFAWTDDTRKSWDGKGPRPIAATVWYPAANAEQKAVALPANRPVFLMGHAAQDAPLAPGTQRFPVVLLSHGTGGSALQMMWLGRELAANGYVALAVDHHGNTAAEPAYDPRGFRLVWERIPDMSVALDRLAADTTFGARIDLDDVTAIGFSLGGYTVTGLAGAKTDLERWRTFCNGPDRDGTCEPQQEYADAADDFARFLDTDPALAEWTARSGNDFTESRVDRVVTIAPAVAQAFAPETLAAIDRPFLIVAASADTVAPPDTNAAYIAEHVPGARLETVNGAGHFVFLSTCTNHGRRWVPVCQDDDSVDRAAVHAAVIRTILKFVQ